MPTTDTRAPGPSLAEAVRVWLRVGLLGFGGPAGQIALMHREMVETRAWISEARFLHALNYCMFLPGPEAQQLATYIGWLLFRTRGALLAGWLFVLPGFVVMLALSAVYAELHHVPFVGAIFYGLKAAVVALVAEALLRIARRALASTFAWTVAVVTFIALVLMRVPFPLVVVAAAIAGAVRFWIAPPTANETTDLALPVELARAREDARPLRVLAIGVLVWWAPVAVVGVWLGRESVLAREGVFFGKAAMVTFGGAYAVLAYVADRVVRTFAWLAPHEMMDGLALAETTPGPLILVLEFVGFMGAYHHPGPLAPLVAGVLGATLTAWVTFVPSFVWILMGAPYIESLRRHRMLDAMLGAVTAAVVGVIGALSAWLALHTFFVSTSTRAWGAIQLELPVVRSLDVFALVLAVAAAVALLRLRVGLAKTLIGTAVAGLLLKGWAGR